MRIDGQPLAIRATSAKVDPSRVPGAAAFRVNDLPASAERSAMVAAPAEAFQLQGLLALQDEGDLPLERKKRAARRGLSLLSGLDSLKLALLSGSVDGAALDQLAKEFSAQRPQGHDPALNDILDAVDVRVAVELAKLGR